MKSPICVPVRSCRLLVLGALAGVLLGGVFAVATAAPSPSPRPGSDLCDGVCVGCDEDAGESCACNAIRCVITNG